MFPSITDVLGVLVGHATDERAATGCTVVLAPGGGMPCTVVNEGSVGAGTGATVGKAVGPKLAMKGGVGSWSVRSGDVVVGAIAVVNAFGDVTDDKGAVIAGARKEGGGFVGSAAYL